MVLEINSILVYMACIIFLFIMGRFFILPLKSIAKIMGNSILGGILIFLVNVIGNFFGFHIGLNIGTAIITGILGIPRSNFIHHFKNMDWLILQKEEKESIITKKERRIFLWNIRKSSKLRGPMNMGREKNF